MKTSRIPESPGVTPPSGVINSTAFPVTKAAIARLRAAVEGLMADWRRGRGRRALTRAVMLAPEDVVVLALTAATKAGFSLHKDGQEWAVKVSAAPGDGGPTQPSTTEAAEGSGTTPETGAT